MKSEIDPERVVITEEVDGATVELMYVETWDGLYAPIGLRRPEGDGPFPIVLLAIYLHMRNLRRKRRDLKAWGERVEKLSAH